MGPRPQPDTEDLQLCSEALETLAVVLMLCPSVLEKLAQVRARHLKTQFFDNMELNLNVEAYYMLCICCIVTFYIAAFYQECVHLCNQIHCMPSCKTELCGTDTHDKL